MSLQDLVVSLTAFADDFTKKQELQPYVLHEAIILPLNGAGKREYDSPVRRQAFVEMKQNFVRSPDGQIAQSKAVITILDSRVIVNILDKFTLPDGTTGPIIGLEGPFNKKTSHLLLTTVYLG